jgi:hypothetical protein
MELLHLGVHMVRQSEIDERISTATRLYGVETTKLLEEESATMPGGYRRPDVP